MLMSNIQREKERTSVIRSQEKGNLLSLKFLLVAVFMQLELRFCVPFNMESLFSSLRQWPLNIKMKVYVAGMVTLQLVNPDLVENEENPAESFQHL